MVYTIAVLEECHGNLVLEIGVHGNKYTVSIYNKETKDSTNQEYDKLEDAYKVFEKLSSWFVFGYYSEKAKRQFLANGTMN